MKLILYSSLNGVIINTPEELKKLKLNKLFKTLCQGSSVQIDYSICKSLSKEFKSLKGIKFITSETDDKTPLERNFVFVNESKYFDLISLSDEIYIVWINDIYNGDQLISLDNLNSLFYLNEDTGWFKIENYTCKITKYIKK